MPETPDLEIADPATGTHARDVLPARPALDTRFFGHPRGLSTLFFTEMWERFSFYGMRAILLLFMTASVAQGGLGWNAAKAGPIYGLYASMVYLTALPGGWIADRLIGQRRSVLVGGILIALGHVSLTFHLLPAFFLGLFLIVCGTGLLKPNISTMVGGLYGPEDARRDAGFSVFYMGINLGAFSAPLVCGFLAQSVQFRAFLQGHGLDPKSCWHWGFGAAAVGMTPGVIQYARGGGPRGPPAPPPPPDAGPRARDRRNLLIGGAVVALLAVILWVQPFAVTDVMNYLLPLV